MKFENSIDIDAPAPVIFKWISDGEHLCRWVSNMESDETIEEKPGHVGSRFRQRFNERGKLMEMEGEVLEWEQDRRVSVKMTGPAFDMTLIMTIDPLSEGRHRVTQDGDVAMKGMAKVLGAAFGWMIRKQAQKQVQTDLDTLRRLCEEEAKSGG